MTTSNELTWQKTALVAVALPLALGVYACSSDGSDAAGPPTRRPRSAPT